MVDKDTILFLIAIIGCAVGVAGFIINMNARAKQEGELLAKIEFCAQGIIEIKGQMKEFRTDIVEMKTGKATNERRIEMLEKEVSIIRKRVDEIAKSN